VQVILLLVWHLAGRGVIRGWHQGDAALALFEYSGVPGSRDDQRSEHPMRYTVLLTPETDPDVYVVYVPVLGVVTQGATVEAALEAAQEAAHLDILGRIDDREEVPVEPEGAIFTGIAVEVPVTADVA
jgi:predicted RNase H-like HicB family nuclease